MATSSTPKINVRDGQCGALGQLNPVVGMTTIHPNPVTIQKVNADGTVVVTGNSAIGGAGASGVTVNPEELFVNQANASGILPNGLRGSWPSGVDVQQFNWSTKSFKTTTH